VDSASLTPVRYENEKILSDTVSAGIVRRTRFLEDSHVIFKKHALDIHLHRRDRGSSSSYCTDLRGSRISSPVRLDHRQYSCHEGDEYHPFRTYDSDSRDRSQEGLHYVHRQGSGPVVYGRGLVSHKQYFGDDPHQQAGMDSAPVSVSIGVGTPQFCARVDVGCQTETHSRRQGCAGNLDITFESVQDSVAQT
jgi:hypothetical protein